MVVDRVVVAVDAEGEVAAVVVAGSEISIRRSRMERCFIREAMVL